MPELYVEVYKLFQNWAVLKKKKDKRNSKNCALVYKQSEKLDYYNIGRRILSDNNPHWCFE